MSSDIGHGAGKIRRSFTRDSSLKNFKVAPETTRRVFQLIKPYKLILSAFLVLIIIDALISVANPLIFKEIINKGIISQRIDIIIQLALLVAGLALVDAGLSIGQNYISSKIGQELIFDLRTKIFAHVQRMPLAFFTRVQTGALVSRLNNDVLGAQQAFTDVLSTVLGNLISVSFVITAMFLLSWRLTLVALLLLPLFIFPARWFGNKLQAMALEGYNLNAQMNTTMIERFNVSGALLSKTFGRPEKENAAFAKKASRVRDIGIIQALYTRFFRIALTLIAALAIALAYGWGGVMAVNQALDIGTVVALTTYLTKLYGPLTTLSNINVDIMTALVSFERVFEILDIKPLITEKSTASTIPRGPARIDFKNVGFAYPSAKEVSLASLESVVNLDTTKEKDVLSDISFTAKPGQMIALVGPSGAGKTTISQLAARLYDVKKGSIKINGIDIRDLKFDTLYEIIGMVTQDAHMFHESIRENLLYAKPDAKEKDLIESLRAAQILPLIESLPQGLDTIVGERGYRLSGGEKQRLAIARLILKSPDIIILDEATAHLDSESEKLIQQALEKVLSHRTSIVIAHRLSTVIKADQILVLKKGRIVETGKHHDLLQKKGLYSQLYRTQFSDEKKNSQKPDKD